MKAKNDHNIIVHAHVCVYSCVKYRLMAKYPASITIIQNKPGHKKRVLLNNISCIITLLHLLLLCWGFQSKIPPIPWENQCKGAHIIFTLIASAPLIQITGTCVERINRCRSLLISMKFETKNEECFLHNKCYAYVMLRHLTLLCFRVHLRSQQ